MSKISTKDIETFLNGRDEQKYIISVECGYDSRSVNVVINDPINGKYVEKHTYKPFLWAKPEGLLKLYKGDKKRIRELSQKNGITFKNLITTFDRTQPTHERLLSGYTVLVEGSCSYGEWVVLIFTILRIKSFF